MFIFFYHFSPILFARSVVRRPTLLHSSIFVLCLYTKAHKKGNKNLERHRARKSFARSYQVAFFFSSIHSFEITFSTSVTRYDKYAKFSMNFRFKKHTNLSFVSLFCIFCKKRKSALWWCRSNVNIEIECFFFLSVCYQKLSQRILPHAE